MHLRGNGLKGRDLIMKHTVALCVIIMFLCIPGCGGDTQESLADESMPIMRDMVATLETVKDEASAKAAKPKLEAIAKKMKSLEERRAKLPMPTEADMKAIFDKHGKEMEELQKKMVTVMLAIQFDPKVQGVLSDIDLKTR